MSNTRRFSHSWWPYRKYSVVECGPCSVLRTNTAQMLSGIEPREMCLYHTVFQPRQERVWWSKVTSRLFKDQRLPKHMLVESPVLLRGPIWKGSGPVGPPSVTDLGQHQRRRPVLSLVWVPCFMRRTRRISSVARSPKQGQAAVTMKMTRTTMRAAMRMRRGGRK